MHMCTERESGVYTMRELESLSGLKRRTILRYRELGILPPPSGRGPYAKWPAHTLTVLQRIKDEVKDTRVTLPEFAERLARERSIRKPRHI